MAQNIQTSAQNGNALIKKDECMTFYNERGPVYLQTDASGIGLETGLLQVTEHKAPDNTALHPIVLASKSLSSTETRYSSTDRKALGIPHELEKIQHYHFLHEVSIITDHKPLVAICKKGVATLSQ